MIPTTDKPLYSLTVEEYKQLTKDTFAEILKENLPPPPAPEEKLLKKKEVASKFGVSIVTIDSWSDRGILTRHRIGRRCFWKESEVLEALQSVKKYERNYNK